jgi:hypothetical protein
MLISSILNIEYFNESQAHHQRLQLPQSTPQTTPIHRPAQTLTDATAAPTHHSVGQDAYSLRLRPKINRRMPSQSRTAVIIESINATWYLPSYKGALAGLKTQI